MNFWDYKQYKRYHCDQFSQNGLEVYLKERLFYLDMEPLKYLPGLNAQHKKTHDYGRKVARKTVYSACTKILPTALGRQGAAQLVSERSKVLRRCAPDSILPSLDWLWEQVQRGLQLGFV